MAENKLGSEKIPKLLLSLALPSIIAQLVNILYNMVDRIYIGHMSSGANAMASLSVALPVITIISAFTQLVGIGGAPLCAINLGKQNKDKAEMIMTNSFVMLIAFGIILTILTLIFNEPILYLFGADSDTISGAVSYTSIYALGTVFVQISLGMNSYINTQGFAKIGMTTVLIGAILNTLLDPLFIFTFNMGISGAALATIISQAVSAIWVLKFLFGKKSTVKIRKKYLKPNLKISLSIMSLGISPFVMTSTESLLQICFNNQLLKFGSNIAVGSMAVLLSVMQLIMMPLSGLCQGAQPILSYNFGAETYSRVRKTYKIVFVICLLFSGVVGGIGIVFSNQVVSIFTNDPETIKFASWALKIYLSGCFFFGMQIASQQSFMALGQAKRSLSMAVFRKIILLIPLIYIFPAVLGNTSFAQSMSDTVVNMAAEPGKAFSVLLAEPVSDILASIVTVTLFMIFYKKNLTKKDKVLE